MTRSCSSTAHPGCGPGRQTPQRPAGPDAPPTPPGARRLAARASTRQRRTAFDDGAVLDRHRAGRIVKRAAAAAGPRPCPPASAGAHVRRDPCDQPWDASRSDRARCSATAAPRTTLTYADRNKTVADEYATASAKIDALYTTTDPEQRLQQLGGEHRRTLASWCNRPVASDCAHETIREGRGYYQTTIEFRPTLKAQADHATRNHQTDRGRSSNGSSTPLPPRPAATIDYRNNLITP